MAGSPAGRKVIRILVGFLGALLIVAGGVYVPLALSRDIPPTPGTLLSLPTGEAAAIVALPESRGAALRLGGIVVASSGGDEPRPMAGAAKVVTALVVLDAFPLTAGEAGPTIPITAADADRYRQMNDLGQRVLRVSAGQQWSEFEVLEAVLLGSSNNHAELLTNWAFGSVDGYLEAAKGWLADNGFDGIRVTDATGLDPANVALARDLARLTEVALGHPVIAEIMATDSVRTRAGERIQNQASYLPEHGIRALSRSYTDPSAICLLFAIDVTVGNDTATVFGAVLGAPSYPGLERDITAVAVATAQNVTEVAVVEQGDAFATYETAWGERAQAVAAETVSMIGWRGLAPRGAVTVRPIGPTPAGVRVGEVVFDLPTGERSVRLVLTGALHGPDPFWLLSHPFG